MIFYFSEKLILRKHDKYEVLLKVAYICLLFYQTAVFFSIHDLDNAHYNYTGDVRHAFYIYIYMCMSVEAVIVVVLV